MSELKEHGEATGIHLLLLLMSNWRSQLKIEFKRWRVKDEQAYKQIVALIQKPEVTKEWIEEKVNEMEQVTIPINSRKKDREYFIRSLVEEIQRK